MLLSTKHSAEECVYLRKYVKYGAAQRVEMNHNADSLLMALRMDYCYVWFITQNVWSRFQIAVGQSSFCVWAAVQTKSTRFSSHLVLLMLGDRRFFGLFGGRRNFRWDWAFVETFFVLVFMSKIRVKARFTRLHCSQAKATDFRWSQMLTVCNTARVQAGYVLWLQLFCSTGILSHSDLQLNA